MLFVAVFAFIALMYIERMASRDLDQFKTHAAILANDVWTLDKAGAKAYLQLAVNANYYKSLVVTLQGDELFQYVVSTPLSGISKILYALGIIRVKKLSTDIMFDDQAIGSLHGEQYVRVIFPLFNILIFLLFVLITLIFMTYLFVTRKYFEQQVQVRTEKLRESQFRFHDLVDLLPEMVLEADLHGRIVYANKAAQNQLDLDFRSDSLSNFADFMVAGDRARAKQAFHDSLKLETSGLQEFTVNDRDGRTFPVLLRSAPIKKDQEITGARMIIVDITERHRLEEQQEQLRRDQKMKAIGLMAGGVAHDLNNILSGIISYPELLLLDLEENSKLRRPLELIRRAGLDASEVVADLLTIARGIVASREVINPNSLIADYLASPDFGQLRAQVPLIDFNTSLAPDLAKISCSPIHIRKCLMNLITNGVEAIQGTGTVSIATMNHIQNITDFHATQNLPEGSYVKIIVSDSGSGIAPHEVDHIFEPFYTKKVIGRSGTGLGLAVVWNTMRDHGGVVSVKTDAHGTTFELFFPSVVDDRISEEPAVLDWQTLKGNGESVLVIDDDPRQREIAGSILTSLNYSVTAASSGEKAVEYMQSNIVDILVLDMIMDPGQNGRITYEKILEIHPGQKAVIASGFAEDDDVKLTLAMGAGAFVAKPYTLEQIGSAIYKILHAG
jgi:PAS domain S-box-containing protein